MKIGKKTTISVSVITAVILAGFLLPESMIIPVHSATPKDWNHNTFWHEPWGSSGVHKGIDIFAPAGRPVIASSYGLVLYIGNIEKGGNVVAILGPKWRIHYYAHLDTVSVSAGAIVDASDVIGSVGNSGNAKEKPPHLHYSIVSILPYFSRADTTTQGWKKIFFLNPGERLLEDLP